MVDDNEQLTRAQARILIDESVGAAINSRISSHLRIIRAFFYGFGLLVIVLVVNGLISERAILTIIHDQVFGFEGNLQSALSGSVAVSYNNRFVLGHEEGAAPNQTVDFYADTAQTVLALIELSHRGSERSTVSIALDEIDDPIWQDSIDTNYMRVDLTDYLQASRVTQRPEKIHYLRFTFRAPENGDPDVVYVNTILNVVGKEK